MYIQPLILRVILSRILVGDVIGNDIWEIENYCDCKQTINILFSVNLHINSVRSCQRRFFKFLKYGMVDLDYVLL